MRTFIRINPKDNVAIAVRDIKAGTELMQRRFEWFMSLVDCQQPWWAAQAAT